MTKFRLKIWGLVGLSVVIGAQACGGQNIHDVGKVVDGEAGTAGTHPGTGGTGEVFDGTSGTHMIPELGGQGGLDPGPEAVDHLTCATCVPLTATENITALAATADEVFWVEHGSYDELLNHQGDGRLLAMPAMGGKPRVVTNTVEGPTELRLSPHYCYMTIDESTAASGRAAFVRVPRAGGDIETLESAAPLPSLTTQFAVGTDHTAWLIDNTVYGVADTAGAEPETLAEAPNLSWLFGDDSLVYMLDKQGLTTMPYTGGTRTTLSKFDNGDNLDVTHIYTSLTVSGDSIYAVEYFFDHRNASVWYLVRMPKAGGAWKRLSTLLEGTRDDDPNSRRMTLVGQSVAVAARLRKNWEELAGRQLLQGNTSPGALLQLVAQAPLDPSDREPGEFQAWDASSAGIFFADGGKIYRAPWTE